jgi:VIT1/CCC1 family predicted Fe2+/Mn2+ transporter
VNETPTFKPGDYMKVPKAVAFLFGALVLITPFLLPAAAH